MAGLRFQLDEHVSSAVAHALRRRGVDLQTAGQAGVQGAPDEAVLARALGDRWVLVTHDSDFLRLHQMHHPHAGVAYCAQGMRTVGQIVAALLLIHEALEPNDMANQIEFL